MINKILIGVNAILIVAVVYLFIRVNSDAGSVKGSAPETSDKEEIVQQEEKEKKTETVKQSGNTPTGKIAYVNIDQLNDESLEIADLVAETKRRRSNIEASFENLTMQYQRKVEEFQMSQKAGIAPESELEAKAREIQKIEQEAQNKQLQMDNLSMEINDKNNKFQKTVREFLVKWNNERYDYILTYSEAIPSMLLGNATLDITDEIIKELNADYKKSKSKK